MYCFYNLIFLSDCRNLFTDYFSYSFQFGIGMSDIFNDIIYVIVGEKFSWLKLQKSRFDCFLVFVTTLLEHIPLRVN